MKEMLVVGVMLCFDKVVVGTFVGNRMGSVQILVSPKAKKESLILSIPRQPALEAACTDANRTSSKQQTVVGGLIKLQFKCHTNTFLLGGL